MNIMKCILCLWFLGIFKREKNCNGHFAVHFPEDARQSDRNQQQKQWLCRAFLALAHGKEPSLPCVFSRCTAKGVTRRLIPAPSVAFFVVRHGKTHDKDYLSCIVRRGARQRVFTVQNATVCPLPCAPMKNARQRVCRAPVAHDKATVSRSDIFSLLNNRLLHSVQIIVRLTFLSPDPTTHIFQKIVQNIIFLRWLALLIKILQNDLNLTMYNFFNKIDN
jgi:hypothetical protein